MPVFDFMLERRLKESSSNLAYRYTCCMSLFELTLNKFLTTFPTFTDHTLLHTLNVTNLTNQLLRQDISKLSASEIYIYLMAAALHDVGMGISPRDLEAFIDAAGIRSYVRAHPELSVPTLIRKFHHDFSAAFVRKYWQLLEIPNERYANAIAEVGRGHRKTDLLDETLYPTAYDLGDGCKANIAALAAVIRIADELDIASDRNPDLLYQTESMEGLSEKDIFEFSRHDAIHPIVFTQQTIRVCADTDCDEIARGVVDCVRVVKETLSYCISVYKKEAPYKFNVLRLSWCSTAKWSWSDLG